MFYNLYDLETEKKLVKDVKRFKNLLRDAQETIERMKQDTTTKSAIKMLRDQVVLFTH